METSPRLLELRHVSGSCQIKESFFIIAPKWGDSFLKIIIIIMISFTTSIKQFGQQGEKTGWTYIEIPVDLAQQLMPGNKKGFRVKGNLDNYKIKRIALIPMGGGLFIMPLNAAIRKGIHKKKGAMLNVQIQVDESPFKPNKDFLACLDDDPYAKIFFNSLPKSHRDYFSKWIDAAKTEPTKIKRIAIAVTALSRKMGFPEMLRSNKKNS